MAESKFKKLSKSIQKKDSVSKKSADAITASIGFKKYGKKVMEQKAKAGKKK